MGLTREALRVRGLCSREWRPAATFAITGVVRGGEEVTVDCLDAGWARLEEPSPGGYVSMEGLSFEETPPAC